MLLLEIQLINKDWRKVNSAFETWRKLVLQEERLGIWSWHYEKRRSPLRYELISRQYVKVSSEQTTYGLTKSYRTPDKNTFPCLPKHFRYPAPRRTHRKYGNEPRHV